MDFRQDTVRRTTARYVTHPKRITHFEGGEYSVGTILISPLLPFKGSMVKQLKQRGFNTDQMTFKNIVALYYNEFISNKENKKSQFNPINAYEFRNNVAFRLKPSDNFEADFYNSQNFTAINDVVNNTIGQFSWSMQKKRKARSDSYEPSSVLTDEELYQANHAERVGLKLEYKALNIRPVSWGDLKGLLLTVVIIWLLLYLVE